MAVAVVVFVVLVVVSRRRSSSSSSCCCCCSVSVLTLVLVGVGVVVFVVVVEGRLRTEVWDDRKQTNYGSYASWGLGFRAQGLGFRVWALVFCRSRTTLQDFGCTAFTCYPVPRRSPHTRAVCGLRIRVG